MREIVLAVKAILDSWQDGTRLDFRGEHTRHTLMPPTFVPGPNPHGPPPVLLGALGPLMTRTAAEVADGLLVMPFHSHRHFRERTLPAVEEGLRRAGPRARSTSTRRRSWRWAAPRRSGPRPPRECAACWRSTAPRRRTGRCSRSRAGATLQPELNALSKRGDIGAMCALVTEEMVETLAVRGTPEECAAELRRRFGDVADRVCAYFPGPRPGAEQIASLARALAGGAGAHGPG